jgi:tetratricopeptide (TPR) repeat protein
MSDASITQTELTRARDLLARGDLEGALKEANSILAKNPQQKEALEIVHEAENRKARPAAASFTQTPFKQAKDHLAKGEWGPALREAKLVLARDPDCESECKEFVLALRESGLLLSTNPHQKEALEVVHEAEARKPRLDTHVPPAPAKEPPKGTPVGYMERALQAYVKGEPEKAIDILEVDLQHRKGGDSSVEAQRMLNNIRQANSYYHQAMTLQAQDRISEALTLWFAFLKTDAAISKGRKSLYFVRTSDLIAGTFFTRGKKEFDKGNLKTAYSFWTKAYKISPQNADVQRGLNRLEEIAARMYREGYTLQELNTEEAMQRWKNVLYILPATHPYYKKAQEMITRYSVNH